MKQQLRTRRRDVACLASPQLTRVLRGKVLLQRGGDRWPSGLKRTFSLTRVERKLSLQNPEILGSSPTPARYDLDEHRTGVRSCITTAWCTLKTPGYQSYCTGEIAHLKCKPVSPHPGRPTLLCINHLTSNLIFTPPERDGVQEDICTLLGLLFMLCFFV